MRRSKPLYLFCALLISIVLLIGSIFLFAGFTKNSRENTEKFYKSLLQSFDWDTFPWDTFPFESFDDFPWEKLPWEDMPWDAIPKDFPWEKIPYDKIPWQNLPDDFPWQDYPFEDLPEEFWTTFPWNDIPEDFDWDKVPFERLPDDMDWQSFPWDKLPEDFPWERVPWDKIPQNFDWNQVPWDKFPEDYDWSKLPWDRLPENFPWDKIPWENMPESFWAQFPWENLPPEAFLLLPWLLINPDLVPEGVFPEGFYPEEWNCEHEFIGDWVTAENPTCVSPGRKYNFCQKCKRVIDEEIPPTGVHGFGSDNICGVCGIRKLVIRSESLSKPYDGLPVSAPVAHIVEESSASLLAGDSLNVAAMTFDSVLQLRKTPNRFTFVGPAVVDETGADRSAAYYIVQEFGVLEMTTRSATICTRDRSKSYDGSPLSGSVEDVYATGLAEGDSIDLSSVVFGEGITEIGRILNTVVSFEIVNSMGERVTSCYSFDTKFGWLRITRAETVAASAQSAVCLDCESVAAALKTAYCGGKYEFVA